jgi:hypothetical protein
MRRVLRGFAPARPQRGPERAGTPIGDGYSEETGEYIGFAGPVYSEMGT